MQQVIGIQQWCIAYLHADHGLVQWNEWTDDDRDADVTSDARERELAYARASAARVKADTGYVQDWAVWTRILTPSAPVRAA
jgi:hypothetical protein